ncbi:hypothetical protein N8I84_42075 (plasmid) [Streptomyces cynarae]|uniref:Uncharacterized protein n=1 Tax=Streptomyces cynarae TaxID=2981134 RepID=A0ABY6EEG2_9ACTN|nr:hypothetical protein [Streptomyces cynarae]UXY25017.1 hypothetical protein N8I84_42075 [Streptomyces cynarae]
MGFIKDAKVESMKGHAQRAISEGRTVFVCRVNQGALQSNWSGPLSGVAEQIEAVEELGWQLDQANFSHDQKNHASAFLIFRRPRGHAVPQQQQIPQKADAPRATSWGTQQ